MTAMREVGRVLWIVAWCAALVGCQDEPPMGTRYLEMYVDDVQVIGHGGTYAVGYELKQGTDPKWIAHEIHKHLAGEAGAMQSIGWPFADEGGGERGGLRLRDVWAYVLADLEGIETFRIVMSDTVEVREGKIGTLLDGVTETRRCNRQSGPARRLHP